MCHKIYNYNYSETSVRSAYVPQHSCNYNYSLDLCATKLKFHLIDYIIHALSG
jgi:hypothetical protein